MNQVSLILDTSLFVNPAAAHVFGKSPTSAFTRFLEIAKDVKSAEFLMPPSIYAELMHFAEEDKISKQLLLIIQKRAPKKHETKVPGIFIYELVETMRDRIDRGLRLAERQVRDALQPIPTPTIRTGSSEVRADADSIARLRESYRRIMREGMLDSKADADLLLLAYELNGTLVSADLGVLSWAEKLGVSILSHDHLHDWLLSRSTKNS